MLRSCTELTFSGNLIECLLQAGQGKLEAVMMRLCLGAPTQVYFRAYNAWLYHKSVSLQGTLFLSKNQEPRLSV